MYFIQDLFYAQGFLFAVVVSVHCQAVVNGRHQAAVLSMVAPPDR